MIDTGLTVALASDYNPGSSPSGNMNFIFALACIKQRMRPAEAFNALTINGAAAMELDHECGSITPGKLANLMLTEPGAGLDIIPYSFGRPRIDRVFIQGRQA
jgi:imidazolonepropionase